MYPSGAVLLAVKHYCAFALSPIGLERLYAPSSRRGSAANLDKTTEFKIGKLFFFATGTTAPRGLRL